jgi:hypothetical protein
MKVQSWIVPRLSCVALLFFLSHSVRAIPSFQQTGNILVMSNVNVRLDYNLQAGTADFFWKNSKKISAFYSGVTLSTGYIKGITYSSWSHSLIGSNQAVVTAVGVGLPTMKQYFTLDQDNSFLIRTEVQGANLSANWFGPLIVDASGAVDLGVANDNRALFVPFDNDHFVRYKAETINGSDTGHEVAAFYDNTTRKGLVVGSVTHDTWKTGIYWSGSNNKLNQMNVFGGANTYWTWDVMPHGSVRGNTISSPTIFVGFGEDWRKTMEDFADGNVAFVPKLAWTNGVPFGWNSWGVIQSSLNYSKAIGVSDFIKTNLQNHGFSNSNTVYVNLDSYWDNLSGSQLQNFANHCHANGQKAGIYWGPFVWWGSSANANNSDVEGTGGTYKYSDVLLRTSAGNFQINDGALAMDPTHPGTKQRIDYYLNYFLSRGFDYIKLDFLSHGALEGIHADTNVMTGIQAYNQGMAYLRSQINGRMFISEAIAPIFPYQYAHSRRIACDAFSSIGDTEYTMNSLSYGWWISGRLYQYSDPDHMVFTGGSPRENQSRLISGAISGTVFLNGDDLNDPVSGQSLARAYLTNTAINAVARTGRTFRPVEGNTGSAAADIFVRQDGATALVAVFNYGASAVNKVINLARAGIVGGFSPLDLWAGASLTADGGTIVVPLAAKQAKLLRFQIAPTLLSPHKDENGAFGFTVRGGAGVVYAIERTANFTGWEPVGTVSNTSGQSPFIQSNLVSPGQFFYRARLSP